MSDKPTILVVDDEPDLCTIISFHLENEGYQVVSKDSGRSAFEWIQDNVCNLVISDVRMPEGDGIELLENIKNNNFAIPVILVSGFSDVGPVEAVSEKGAVAMLPKPIDFPELLVIVKNNLKE